MKKIIPLKTALPIIDGLMTDSSTELIDNFELHDTKSILYDGNGERAILTIEKTWVDEPFCTADKERCRCYDEGKCRAEKCHDEKDKWYYLECKYRKQNDTAQSELRITLDWNNVGIFEYRDVQGASVRDGLQNIRKQVFDFVFS